MHEDVGEFEVAMHDLVLDEGLEGVEHLEEELDGLILLQGLLLLEVLHEVALVAVHEDEVEVVGGLLDIVELDYVYVVAGLEDFDLVFEELHELA